MNNDTKGVYIGSDGISLGVGSTFSVDNDGNVEASNLTISGGIFDVWLPEDGETGLRFWGTEGDFVNKKLACFSYGASLSPYFSLEGFSGVKFRLSNFSFIEMNANVNVGYPGSKYTLTLNGEEIGGSSTAVFG